jgi:membrane protein DedA with SNARE-associated domain
MKITFTEEKFVLAIFGILVLGGVAVACAHWAAIQAVFSSFVGGVVGIYTVYAGGNLGHKFIDGKFPQDDHKDNIPKP